MAGTGDANQTDVMVTGQEEGAVTGPGGIEQEGEGQAVVAEDSIIEVRDFGIQAGDLDEYAEYFECFLKIGDCLPRIIVCGTDEEMPRIVVCEGLKRKPPVDATDETKNVLLEIQKQVAEMINAVQVNTILREEINHIEGGCPVIKIKEVMKRINDTTNTTQPPCEEPPPKLCTCKEAAAANNYCRYSSNPELQQKSFKSSHSYEQAKSKDTLIDTIEVTCSMCFKRTQPVITGCCCKHSADADNTCEQLSAANMSKGSDVFSDEDIKALIDKCLGPPCNFCVADKYDSIVDDLDMQANMFSKTGQKIYDVIVPTGYKDQQGWGGNHNIERPVLAPTQVPCNAEKYAATVEELKGELSKLEQLGDMICAAGTTSSRSGNIDCVSSSCISAANYLNSQIAQIEEELDTLRLCLDKSRKERKALETQQNIFSCMKPLCYS